MTVGELIEALRAFDPELEVYAEGCEPGCRIRVAGGLSEELPGRLVLETD